MVKGLDLFKEHFSEYTDHYVLIGGTACSLAFDEVGGEFRVTKDLDIVLTLEMLDAEFANKLWEFIKAGRYSTFQKSNDKDVFYRFHTPENADYPQMLELFARNPGIELPADAHLTKLHWEQVDDAEAKSLSAILMNEEYYELIHKNKEIVSGVMTIKAPYLIPLKAQAWLDMQDRKAKGDQIDEKDIRKHRNDIVRLAVLLAPETKVNLPDGIKTEMARMLEILSSEKIFTKDLGVNRSLEQIVEDLRGTYMS